jgi:hypothetical protein
MSFSEGEMICSSPPVTPSGKLENERGSRRRVTVWACAAIAALLGRGKGAPRRSTLGRFYEPPEPVQRYYSDSGNSPRGGGCWHPGAYLPANAQTSKPVRAETGGTSPTHTRWRVRAAAEPGRRAVLRWRQQRRGNRGISNRGNHSWQTICRDIVGQL